MHQADDHRHQEIAARLNENQRLLQENNALLHKIRRDATIAMVLRLVWFGVLIGVPLALYYLLLEPNFATLERAYQIIESGASDLSGLRQLYNNALPKE